MSRKVLAITFTLVLLAALLVVPGISAQGPATEAGRGQPVPAGSGPFGPAKPLANGGLLYMTTLDIGNATFAVYDPAANAWTNLNPFETGCQMAVDSTGLLYGFNYSSFTIDLYDPATDTWAPVAPAPPAGGAQCNLEITNDGQFVYSGWYESTLWHYTGGVWQSLSLPFIGNAMGDYDPTTDQYVIGEAWTTNAHLVDVHTWTITDYYSPVGNGENARFSSILDNRYYFEAGGSNLHYFDLANPGAAPVDTGVNTSWYGSSAADRGNHVIYNASLDGTALWLYDPATNTATPLAGGPYLWHSSIAFTGTGQPVPTMHVGGIEGFFKFDAYGRPFLVARAQAADEGGAPLQDAAVTATITPPNGVGVTRTRLTRASGNALFHWGSNPWDGNWELCVDYLTLAGYVYDSGDNVVTCVDWFYP